MDDTARLPDVVVANIHRRFTGVSATVAALIPVQQTKRTIAVVDTGQLGVQNTWPFLRVLLQGWSRPKRGKFRIWHARRDVEMIAGIFLKIVLRQRWKLVFTSAAPKRHGVFLRFLMNRMDAIIATSARAAGFLDWHSVIIGHGVDPDDFTLPEDKHACFATSGLPGRFSIGCFGRVRPSKGTDIFVAAMIRVLPDYPDFTAFITGLCKPSEQAFREKLEQQIAEAGLSERILFLGDLSHEEIRHWYQRCLICVAASRQEGFGLTPMEAMSSGAIAVTSHAGYWPELITPQSMGALFETGSAEALAKVLPPFLDAPEATIESGLKARTYIVAHHSITTEAEAILAVYETLATQPMPRLSPPEIPA